MLLPAAAPLPSPSSRTSLASSASGRVLRDRRTASFVDDDADDDDGGGERDDGDDVVSCELIPHSAPILSCFLDIPGLGFFIFGDFLLFLFLFWGCLVVGRAFSPVLTKGRKNVQVAKEDSNIG